MKRQAKKESAFEIGDLVSNTYHSTTHFGRITEVHEPTFSSGDEFFYTIDLGGIGSRYYFRESDLKLESWTLRLLRGFLE